MRRVVGVRAGVHKIAAAERIVVSDGGRCESADDADRVTSEYGRAEALVSASGVSALRRSSASAIRLPRVLIAPALATGYVGGASGLAAYRPAQHRLTS